MKCPYCGSIDTKVIDSRPTEDGERIRRRRECLDCGKRFTTYEIVETTPITVVKKDGSIQAYDRNKILNGMLKSCEKRQVSVTDIEKAVSDIEYELTNNLITEISSQELGEMVMDKLKVLDEVAYVRFASVYRQFSDVNTFFDELSELLKAKKQNTD